MGTRTSFQEDEGLPIGKRQKFDDKSKPNPQAEISVRSVADIKKLLVFHQDDVLQYRLSLQAFRRYLERLESDGAIKSSKDEILLEYLSTATITTSNDQVEALPDIFQAWRYATQVYDEGLMVAIPGVLTTLLRAISSTVEFAEIGGQICKTIIRKENTSILQKSLNSSRARDASIARCLDLLIQVVSFDGGAYARSVWLQRDITMQRLPQFLEMSKKTIYGAIEPLSVRDYAITFFLTNLRYQNQEAKADILSIPRITQILLRDVVLEKPQVVKEILLCLKNTVLRDDELRKSAKGPVFTNVNLGYVLGIMRHKNESIEWSELHDVAESFLIESCTSSKHGIVYKQHGWYPWGTQDLVIKQEAQSSINITLTNELDKYKDTVPVRNTTLAKFIPDLKPWASVSERRLMMKIFEAAPELVADYLLRKKTFSFEPKLTATWIGWANFLYSVLRLPCISYDVYLDGRIRMPPPIPVVIQSILPQSLTRQVLTKALKHQSELIQLFTLRILVASFEKTREVLNIFQAQANPTAWKNTGKHILKELAQRWPEYKQIFHLYRSYPQEKHILREISSSLLMLYNTVTPQIVSVEKMDISLHVTRMLNRVVAEIGTCDASTFMELEHLLGISNCTIEAKWWQKSENATVTSVTTILQLLATSGLSQSRLSQDTVLKSLVREILELDYLLVPSENVNSLGALLMSLTQIKVSHQKEIFEHLDGCMLRFIRKPIQYHGDIDDLIEEGKNGILTPLFMVLLEQWPFFLKDHDSSSNIAGAEWQSVFLIKAAEAGESIALLQAVCNRFEGSTENKEVRQVFADCQSSLENIRAQGRIIHSVKATSSDGHSDNSTISKDQIKSTQLLLEARLSIPEESLDHPALSRWSKKDISDAILDSDISNLIRYLASKYPETRKQARSALQRFMNDIKKSKHPARLAIYYVVGEILETLTEQKGDTSLPSIAIALAARLIFVANDASHDVFKKMNEFLGRAPSWNLAKLPSYWMAKIFNERSGRDDERKEEIEWLLDTLIEGLQTKEDVNLYRRTGVFERVMLNCSSTCYEKMFDLLYRCCMVGGGSTLITRFGVLQWIATQRSSALLMAFETKLLADIDDKHVRRYLGKDDVADNDNDEEGDDDHEETSSSEH